MKHHSQHHPVLGPLLESWELSLEAENKADRTIGNYLDGLGMFCRWLDEHHPEVVLAAISAGICREWIAFQVITNSPSTGRTRWAAMRQFWGWAALEGEVAVNPMENVKQPALVKKTVDVLTPAELRALLATCSGNSLIERRDQAIMTLFGDTGMRASACAGAMLDKLDLRRREIVVTEKGRKVVVKAFGVATARALDRYLRTRGRSRWPATSGPLFISVRDGRAMNRNSVLQMLKRRGREAGVPGLHPHMFRHTFVDQWLRAGGTETGLMHLVDWTSRDMLEVYAEATRAERAREEHRRLSPMDHLDD